MNPRSLDSIGVTLRSSHLVEAGAGTGKTYAIATLYIRLLLELELRASQILVVTYTNAAAAELRVRIRNRLRDTLTALDAGGWAGDPDLNDFIRARLERGDDGVMRDRSALIFALHAFDEAAIFTIHGFCQRVLQESAFESGVAFDTELLTSLTALVDEVVDDYWVRQLHDAPSDMVDYLRGSAGKGGVGIDTLQRIALEVATHADIEVLPLLAETPSKDEPLAVRAVRFKRDLADYARRELRRRKEAARQQSFDDLLQRLRAALAGPGGEALAAAVRERYRAALIDEFQDTDPVQYDIFRRIYVGTDAPLFVIGDPKQAIYAFRGADVFTYMAAKRRTAEAHTLLTNRRSDPTLLRAINAIFQSATPPFVFEAIGYESIEPAPGARDRLGGSRHGKPPFEILFTLRDGLQLSKTKPRNMIVKPAALEYVTTATAAYVAGFLAQGATVVMGDTERPVQPSDIAILCRRNREAADVQEALRRLGVHAVLQSDATVFETAEAGAVERTLQALANPTDGRALRAALATPLFGLDAAALDALESDELARDTWAARFRDWHDRWLERGFVVAFRALLDDREIEKRLLASIGGERQLTDILHLVELLHRASVEQRLGPQALVHWLAQMRSDATVRGDLLGDAARVRLESDEAAVKLVTIHRSKGLEYPVVLCPFSWGPAGLHFTEKPNPRFHDADDDNRLKIDLGSADFDKHTKRAELEALAEDLRLLYVAFTRAKHYCGVVWGAFRGGQDSALAYLLHGAKDKESRTRVTTMSDDELLAELRGLAQTSGDAVGIVPLPAATTTTARPPQETLRELRLPPTLRYVRTHWRTSSFSALTAKPMTPLGMPDEEGIDHDAAAVIETPEPRAAVAAVATESLPFADLQAGARSGLLVHRIFEKIDFVFQDPAELRSRIDAVLGRTGQARAQSEILFQGVEGVLDTPLGGSARELRLRQVPAGARLNELEFLLPVGAGHGAMLTVAKLAAVFARHGYAAYADRVAQLGFTALEGFLKGYVDLVFSHGGQWYVVDYKTNRLGFAVADYEPRGLADVMALHHYYLQYHLYVVALHRYLTQRLAIYDYGAHFGGVYYLFVRGMSPRHPAGSGIYYDRPTPELIEELSSLFGPRGGSQ